MTDTAGNAQTTLAGSPQSVTVTRNGEPDAPVISSVTAGNAQVVVAWGAPANNGAAITDYVVQYSTSSAGSYTTFADGTSTSTSATVTGLTNGTAYYFKVAATNSVGTGSYSAASAAATPSVTYNLGDTGPGGGIVFYVSATNFTSTGSDCDTACKYLEAATSDLANRIWCSNTSTSLNVTATGIGSGMSNTTTADVTCSSGAIQAAADYTNNGKIDWHLPSILELNQLCRYAWSLVVSNTTTTCTNMSGTIRSGFSTVAYWSSSEGSSTQAAGQIFSNGSQRYDFKDDYYNFYVRPVRAFG